ncbi:MULTISPECIES: PstS family phosphate ABC transporter substrate-binding protein [Roseomonadaceae]|uniref:Substrate-binding domain-containing protein n=1 Tax=Falsiroseomonas oleicola TaxID=2801474 RepID=A0ABS6HEC3_9PROT|nr:substrate-binding domain-containing protein [Roseomonas oleicola]MBU8546162.1 substrate-binding domain-containing protein [Roseomonas oleicola]
MEYPFALGRRGLLALLPLSPVLAGAEAPLRIGGTGMALVITRRLLDLYRGAENGPGVVVLDSLGTSGGLAALRSGLVDIALSSRMPRPEEQAMGLVAQPLARTPVAFATRHDTPVEGLSQAEAVAILSGDTADWPRGGQVRLVLRDRSETDWAVMATASPAMAEVMQRALNRPGLALAVSDQENAELLEQLPGSFGLTTLGQTRAEHRQLRLLALDGVPPGLEAMAAGSYRFARGIFAVTRSDAPPLVQAVLRFLGTPQAQRRLRDSGFLPVTEHAA